MQIFIIMGALNFYLQSSYGNELISKALLSRESVIFTEFSKAYTDRYVVSRSMVNTFGNAIQHFLRFQNALNHKFESYEVNKEIIERFIVYLIREVGLADSTTGTVIRCIKFLIKKIAEYGYAYNPSYTEARFRESESFKIALEKREIARLYYADNCGLTRRQKEIKDLFVLECQTGLRYSDLSRLKKDHIINNTIQIIMKKTRVKACIPVNKYVKEIFEKYNFSLPNAPCIQSFNVEIKKICKKAGLTRIVSYESDRGGELFPVQKKLYEMISSHTGRRSFVTNMLRDKIPETSIMKCTGHKSTSAFSRYNKISPEENAIILSTVSI